MGRAPNGPAVRLAAPGNQAAVAALLGIPVLTTTGEHSAECPGCGGAGTDADCEMRARQERNDAIRSTSDKPATPPA